MAWLKLLNGLRSLKRTVFPSKDSSSINRSTQNRKQLLLTVNELVKLGKLGTSQDLLEEALIDDEDPEILDLLYRVHILQQRPQEAASVMQRALLSRRQKASFVEPIIKPNNADELDDDAVSDVDLEYLSDSSKSLVGLNDEAVWQHEIIETSNPFPDPLVAAGSEGDTAPSSVYDPKVINLDLPSKDAHTPVEPRKILSLSKPETLVKKHTDINIQVKHSSPPVDEMEQHVCSTSLAASLPSMKEAAPSPESITNHTHNEPSEPTNFYTENDIQELVTGSTTVDFPFQPLLDDPDNDLDIYESDDADLCELRALFDDQSNFDDDFAYDTVAVTDEFEDKYEAYIFDPDEIYDMQDNALSDSSDLLDGQLSREDRALQKAAELISSTGWPLNTLPLIQNIFIMSGWGASRLALEREIERGMTPDELILATHVKVIWAENDYYWISYDQNGSSNLSQYILSWPSALLIVRSFESLPQLEELEHFIESLFEYWYEKIHLRKVFRSFNRFLWFRMSSRQGALPANLPFNFESPHELQVDQYSDLGLTDMLEIERTAQLRAFGVFQTKHPQEPSCYFSDKSMPVEEYSMATD